MDAIKEKIQRRSLNESYDTNKQVLQRLILLCAITRLSNAMTIGGGDFQKVVDSEDIQNKLYDEYYNAKKEFNLSDEDKKFIDSHASDIAARVRKEIFSL